MIGEVGGEPLYCACYEYVARDAVNIATVASDKQAMKRSRYGEYPLRSIDQYEGACIQLCEVERKRLTP